MAGKQNESKRDLKPQQPGTTPDPRHMPPQQDAPEPKAEDNPETPPNGDEKIEITRAQLADLVQAEVEKQVVDAVKAARRRAMEKPDPYKDLPDQKEIDPKKIDRAVLTKQGWVAPDKRHLQTQKLA